MAEINRIYVFVDKNGNKSYAVVDKEGNLFTAERPIRLYPGSSGQITGGEEWTVVGLTVATDKKFYLVGWAASGTADGIFKLCKGDVVLMEKRNSAAKRNVSERFPPVEFDGGEVISIKVKHEETGVQEFYGTLMGYEI